MTTTPGKLTKLAEARGVSVPELIVEAINLKGSKQAAATHLGVTPNALQHHIQRHGIKINRKTLVESETA